VRIRSWWSFVLLLLLCAPVPAITADSAHLVKDINPGVEPLPEDPSLGSSFFFSYTPVNGRVVFMTFFRDEDSLTGDFQCGLWATDGAAGGTERLAELCAGAESPNSRPGGILATTGAVAFFTDSFGLLWRTDGTAAGTFKLANVSTGNNSLGSFRLVGQTLFFDGCTLVRGCELWRSDGTREGTRLVRDIAPGPFGSYPQGLEVWRDQLWFRARDAVHGMELWTSDGSADGTRLVQDVAPGPSWSLPLELTGTDQALYFSASDSAHGRELWMLPEP